MKGVILSHTRMGTRGICTTFALEVNGQARQIRPRMAPGNMPAHLGSFGYTSAVMQECWQPGHVVTFEGFEKIPKEHRRTTHPEDVYLTDPEDAIVTAHPQFDAEQMAAIVEPFTYDSFMELYPHLRWQGNRKAYTPPDAVNPRSVGYVRCLVTIQPEERATVMDDTMRQINCKVKDELLLSLIRDGEIPVGHRFEDALVRFSLANAFGADKAVGEDRCYVMLSHIVR